MKWFGLTAGMIGRALVIGVLLGAVLYVGFGLYAGTETTMSAVATGLVVLLVLLLILPRIRKGRNTK